MHAQSNQGCVQIIWGCTVLPIAVLMLNLLLVPLTFNRVEKTKLENFDFVYLFLSFFYRNNLKRVRSLWILNIPNNCSAIVLRSYLFWASCELWVASFGLKRVAETLHVLMRMLLGFSRMNCVGIARIVRPHLDYCAHAVQAARSVRRSLFVVFSINLVYSKAIYSSRDCCCLWM